MSADGVTMAAEAEAVIQVLGVILCLIKDAALYTCLLHFTDKERLHFSL